MRVALIVVVAAPILALTPARARTQRPQNAQDVLQQLNAATPEVREAAFMWLTQHHALQRSPAVAHALIRAIDLESRLVRETLTKYHGQRGSDESSEGDGEYPGNLLEACKTYCDLDDPRTIRTLAASPFGAALSDILITHHPSETLRVAIANVASGSLYMLDVDVPLMARMRSESRSLSAAERDQLDSALIACVTAKNWIASELAIPRIAFLLKVDTTIAPVRRQGYHAAMLAATQHAQPDIRAAAAEALAVFRDPADRPRLSQLATSDAASNVRASARRSLSVLPPSR